MNPGSEPAVTGIPVSVPQALTMGGGTDPSGTCRSAVAETPRFAVLCDLGAGSGVLPQASAVVRILLGGRLGGGTEDGGQGDCGDENEGLEGGHGGILCFETTEAGCLSLI